MQMNKLDSMWWHEAKGNGKLASSHTAVLFCALAKNGMIVDDLLEMEFKKIPGDLSDETLSPMDYCLAYTDGELFEEYVKPGYRKLVKHLYETNKIYDIISSLEGLEHDMKNSTYTLKCSWKNVKTLSEWLKSQLKIS
jgi:hypothetical protein